MAFKLFMVVMGSTLLRVKFAGSCEGCCLGFFFFFFFFFCADGGCKVLTWVIRPRSKVVFDMGGSGPAAAKVESARTAMERRMVILGGALWMR